MVEQKWGLRPGPGQAKVAELVSRSLRTHDFTLFSEKEQSLKAMFLEMLYEN